MKKLFGASATALALAFALAGTVSAPAEASVSSSLSQHVETSAVKAARLASFKRVPTPTISGTTTVGRTLTAYRGSWSPAPTRVSYQWYRNGQAIKGATRSTYALTATDGGKRIQVKVTGSRSGYSTVSKVSAAKTIRYASFSKSPYPTISGTTTVGQRLTVNRGYWSPSPTKVTYRWYRNGVAIYGATGSAYTLTASDAGKRIQVRTISSRAGYYTLTRTSSAKTISNASFKAPVPTISGTATVGQKLTASRGTWSPSASTYAYRWYRNGVAIFGATGSSYALTASDAGKRIHVVVSGARAGYTSVSKSSSAKTIATASFASAPVPTIVGSVTVGNTVTVSAGTWSPSSTGTTIQWLRDGVAISGATKSSYTLLATDTGKKISVKVTASRSGYTTTSRTSAAQTVLAKSFASAPAPSLSGGVTVGQTMKVSASSWSPEPTTATYQWLRNGVAIPGAVKDAYTLTAADAGKAISVTMTGSKSGYVTTSKTSSARAIGLGVLSPADPVVTGSFVGIGKSLSVVAEGWPSGTTFSYRWLRDGRPITNATKSTYTTNTNDLDRWITVEVTGAAAGYVSTMRGSEPKQVTAAPFDFAPAPGLGAKVSFKVGQQLSSDVTENNWSPLADSLTFQWMRDGQAIPGANSRAYTPGLDDLGKEVRLDTTAARDGYITATRSSVSGVVAPGDFTTSTPSVSGLAQMGYELTADAQEWAWSPEPAVVTYQWLRDGQPIEGATSTAYRLIAADVDKKVTVQVSGSREGYNTGIARAAEKLVLPAAFSTGSPIVTVVPTADNGGRPMVDQTLTVTAGTWSPQPAEISYQWFRDGQPIAGATGSTYTAVAADLGQSVSAVVTGSLPGYKTTALESPKKVIEPGVFITNRLVLEGGNSVGGMIQVTQISSTPSANITYQWYRGPYPVAGATSDRYAITAADKGQTITLDVTWSREGYEDIIETSDGFPIN